MSRILAGRLRPMRMAGCVVSTVIAAGAPSAVGNSTGVAVECLA